MRAASCEPRESIASDHKRVHPETERRFGVVFVGIFGGVLFDKDFFDKVFLDKVSFDAQGRSRQVLVNPRGNFNRKEDGDLAKNCRS